MLKSENEALCGLLTQKADLLVKYDELSEKLLTVDFDRIEKLLDVRHEFLLEFNKITPKIDEIIVVQPQNQQNALKSMLKYEGLDTISDGDLIGMKNILIKMKALIDSINKKTKQTTLRFNKQKQELQNEMLKLNQSRKIIDFVGSASESELFRGKRLDEKK